MAGSLSPQNHPSPLGQSVQVLKSPEALYDHAAVLFKELFDESIKARGSFTVALAGGSTPAGLYMRLSEPPYSQGVQWDKVEVFFGDERCVGPDDSASNYRMAREALLGKVYGDASPRVHRIKGELGPDKAASDYESVLAEVLGPGLPCLDLVLLGLGQDGHTASLFPGSAALMERQRLAIAVTETDTPRVSLSLPVINNARNIIFMATGTSKADALARILGEGNQRDLPAGLVQPSHGRSIWLLDTLAASKIQA